MSLQMSLDSNPLHSKYVKVLNSLYTVNENGDSETKKLKDEDSTMVPLYDVIEILYPDTWSIYVKKQWDLINTEYLKSIKLVLTRLVVLFSSTLEDLYTVNSFIRATIKVNENGLPTLFFEQVGDVVKKIDASKFLPMLI